MDEQLKKIATFMKSEEYRKYCGSDLGALIENLLGSVLSIPKGFSCSYLVSEASTLAPPTSQSESGDGIQALVSRAYRPYVPPSPPNADPVEPPSASTHTRPSNSKDNVKAGIVNSMNGNVGSFNTNTNTTYRLPY